MGSFSGIDWSAGSYYLQTETDPLGGTDYAITGASQLISVPYALYARSADSLAGDITESDPVFQGSVAGGIKATDTIRWNGKISIETQNLADILILGNDSRGSQFKNIGTPTDDQDAATKAYVDSIGSRVSAFEDMLARAGLYIVYETDSTTLPVVATNSITDIYQHEAVSGGTITPAGGPEITAKGVCWSTSPAPDTSDNKTYDGYGLPGLPAT